MAEVFIGIDLGGTNIKAGLFDSAINLIAKDSVAAEIERGPGFVVGRIVESVKGLLAKAGYGLDDIGAVGIGSPGPADYRRGMIISLPFSRTMQTLRAGVSLFSERAKMSTTWCFLRLARG